MVFMIPFARVPKRSEDSVSPALEAADEQQMINAILASPFSVSYSTRASHLSPSLGV